MKKSVYRYLFFVGFMLIGLFIFPKLVGAAPANIEEFVIEQPTGETFKVQTKGDESLNYVITEAGDTLDKGKDGFWYYIQSKVTKSKENKTSLSNKKVGVDVPPTNVVKEESFIQLNEKKDLNYENSKRRVRTTKELENNIHNTLVLLVDFDDVKIKYSTNDWQNLIFGEVGSTLKDYYKKNTKGKVDIQPVKEIYESLNDGIIRVKLDGKHPDTQGNISIENQNIARKALERANQYIDYNEYDTNKNGRIEAEELHLMIIVAGQEKSFGNVTEPSVWGHRWALNSQEIELDNTYLDYYTQFGEKHAYRQATLGIIAHEFGHDLGLPDLYNVGTTDTNGKDLKIGSGLGYTSIMSSGSWGSKKGEFSGQTPVGLDAYSKSLLGMDVETIKESDSRKLVQAIDEGEPTILKINSKNEKEYFLIENRQLSGYDQGMERNNAINSGGVAIYRVNRKYDKNYTTGQQLVTVLEADESIRGNSYYGIGGNFGADPFYYIGTGMHNVDQKTKVAKYTTPSTAISDESKENFSLSVSSASNSKMYINILYGDDHGNSLEESTVLGVGTHTGVIDYKTDQDWFQMVVAKEQPLVLISDRKNKGAQLSDNIPVKLITNGSSLFQEENKGLFYTTWDSSSQWITDRFKYMHTKLETGVVGDKYTLNVVPYSTEVPKVETTEITLGVNEKVQINAESRNGLPEKYKLERPLKFGVGYYLSPKDEYIEIDENTGVLKALTPGKSEVYVRDRLSKQCNKIQITVI